MGRAPGAFQIDVENKNLAVEFELWLEDFEAYVKLQKVDALEDKRQLLLNLGGLDIRRIVKGLPIKVAETHADDEERDVYSPLKTALQTFFKPSVNITAERHVFRLRKQQEGESVTAFVGALRTLASRCEFDKTNVDTIVNCIIRDQVIEGLRSSATRKELLAMSSLTLDDAVAKAVGAEAATRNAELYGDTLNTAQPTLDGIALVRQTSGHVSRRSKAIEGRQTSMQAGCGFCGHRHQRGRSFCPAAQAKCHNCQKIGHFARVCRQPAQQVNTTMLVKETCPADITDEVTLVYSVAQGMPALSSHDPQFWISLLVDGNPICGLLDTGAVRTILPASVVSPQKEANRALRAYGGRGIHTMGMASVTIATHGGRSMNCECFVVEPGLCPLFGQDVIRALRLVALTLDQPEVNTLDIVPVDIAVQPDARPIAAYCRRHAFCIRGEIEAEINRLCAAEIIEPVKGVTPWVSPIVPCRKSDGSLRLCIDYRQLNKHIIRERRVMPTAEEIFAQVHGAAVFSVLDAEAGFHQIPLSEASRHLTSFVCHVGVFRFRRLPFGIACAPEVFQRVMSDLLAGLPGVFVYIDDVLVTGRDLKEHDDRLRLVLSRLQAANMKLNWKKCRLRKSETKLGFISKENSCLTVGLFSSVLNLSTSI